MREFGYTVPNRDNILFGKKYPQSKYNTIIESCAMEPDLNMLPGGDNIEIGEKVWK